MDILKAEIERKRKLLEEKKLVVCISAAAMLMLISKIPFINLPFALYFWYQIEHNPQSADFIRQNKQPERQEEIFQTW